MKDLIELVKAIGTANIGGDLLLGVAIVIIAYKMDKISAIQRKREEEFYELINSILKRQNKILFNILRMPDNHKGSDKNE